MDLPVIAITMGDPGGVGPEVIIKSLKKIKRRRAYYVVIGSRRVFDFLKSKIKKTTKFHETKNLRWTSLKKNTVNFFNIDKKVNEKKLRFHPAKLSRVNALLALESLDCALKGVRAGNVQAIVTAPLSKEAVRFIYPRFTGHTEYLAKAFRVKEFAMMFVSKSLKVTLATIHVPIKKVSLLITPKLVAAKIKLTHIFLKKYFKIKQPKLAVCALNPHGRETGNEDPQKVLPAVKKMKRAGIHAEGPRSADQLFYDAYRGKYDAVISMYHDQGLGPFKMIAFHDGVNVTLGLPFIRTSPDHGTAFDIAYRNKSNPESMVAAIRLAEKLAANKR